MGRIGGHAGQIKDAADQATPDAPASMPMPDKSTQQTKRVRRTSAQVWRGHHAARPRHAKYEEGKK
ncbi:hypothetical protein ACFS07_31990 [Undibacterium arcticum]